MQRHLYPPYYSILAVLLHWSLAFALAFQMGLGWHMSGLQDSSNSGLGLFAVAQLHKSVGILILFASITRLILRIYKKPPIALHDDVWAHNLSKYTHIALYTFMIGTPLSGWLIVSSSNLNIDTYIFDTLYWPHIPGIEFLSDTSRSTLNMVSSYAHEILTWAGIILFFMHVAGALRHQFFKGEDILWRILPIIKPIGKTKASLAILVIMAALIGLFTFVQYNVNGLKPSKIEYNLPSKIETQSSSNEDQNLLTINTGTQPSEIEQIEENEEIIENSDKKDEADDISKEEVSKTETIKPSKWTITGPKSLNFSVKWNDDVVTGSFSDWRADIKFASAALDQSSIKVLINLTSVATSDATVNSAIGNVDFFNFSTSSEAQYSSTSINSLGGNRYQMEGVLRLKNIQQPLRIIFTLDENGNSARAKGNANINRLAHQIGVDQNEIANDVSVNFDFTANK